MNYSFEFDKSKMKKKSKQSQKQLKFWIFFIKSIPREIKVGLSERDLQAKIIFEAMKMGANPPSYRSTLNPLIIAGGPNGALPHAEISNSKFMIGDMIVVDFTLRYFGYIADATRTFALVSVTSEMKKIYDIVKQSQQAGIDASE